MLSTMVVMAGLAASAGSCLIHLMNMGSVAPMSVDTMTCRLSDRETMRQR